MSFSSSTVNQHDLPRLPPDQQKHFEETLEKVRELAAKIKAEKIGRFSSSLPTSNPTAAAIIPPRPRQTVEVMVPINRASALLIGNAEPLKRIEKMSGAQIIHDTDYVSNEDRKFLVTGVSEDIDEAKRLMIERPLNFSNHPSVTITVPQVRIGLMIGKGGETIREIQEKSGAKIVMAPDLLPADAKPSGDRERIVTVIGESAAIDRAKDMIEEIVFGVVKSGASSILKSIKNSAIMQIPDSATGAVIGKKAETMKGIQEVSGAKLFVDPAPIAGTALRNVYLSGPDESIALAQQLITEKVRQVDPCFGYNYDYNQMYAQPGADPSMMMTGYPQTDPQMMMQQQFYGQQPDQLMQQPMQQQYQADQQTVMMDFNAYSAYMAQYYPQVDPSVLQQYYAHYVATFTAQTAASYHNQQ